MATVNENDIKTKLLHCSVCRVPSRSEAFGSIAAEALCCGSPIIATNVGGLPEVIKLAKSNLTKNEVLIFNDWVKLVEPNVKSLTKGIDDILKNLLLLLVCLQKRPFERFHYYMMHCFYLRHPYKAHQ